MAEGAADKAIAALNGTNVGGRALNVNEGGPKQIAPGAVSAGAMVTHPASVASPAGKLEFLSGRAGSVQPVEAPDAVAIHGLRSGKEHP